MTAVALLWSAGLLLVSAWVWSGAGWRPWSISNERHWESSVCGARWEHFVAANKKEAATAARSKPQCDRTTLWRTAFADHLFPRSNFGRKKNTFHLLLVDPDPRVSQDQMHPSDLLLPDGWRTSQMPSVSQADRTRDWCKCRDWSSSTERLTHVDVEANF